MTTFLSGVIRDSEKGLLESLWPCLSQLTKESGYRKVLTLIPFYSSCKPAFSKAGL